MRIVTRRVKIITRMLIRLVKIIGMVIIGVRIVTRTARIYVFRGESLSRSMPVSHSVTF